MPIPFTLDINVQPQQKDIKWVAAGDWAKFDDTVFGLEAGDTIEQATITVKLLDTDADDAATSVQRSISAVASANGQITSNNRIEIYFQPVDTEKMVSSHLYDLQIWVRRGSSLYIRTIQRGRIYARQDITNNVTLLDPMTTLTITNGASASGNAGTTLQLVAEVRDGQGDLHPEYNPVWTTSNGAVATVDATGLVRFWGAGTCVITATLAAFSIADSINITTNGANMLAAVNGDVLTFDGSVWNPANPNTRFVLRGGDTVAGTYTWQGAHTFQSNISVINSGGNPYIIVGDDTGNNNAYFRYDSVGNFGYINSYAGGIASVLKLNTNGGAIELGGALTGTTANFTTSIKTGLFSISSTLGLVEFATNATAPFLVNYAGYNYDVAYFRDFVVYDGKTVPILTITGSTKATVFAGSVSGGAASFTTIAASGNVTITKASGNEVALVLAQTGVATWEFRNAATSGVLTIFDGTDNVLCFVPGTNAAVFAGSITATNLTLDSGVGIAAMRLLSGGVYGNWTVNSLSMGFSAVGAYSWIQSGGAATGAPLHLNEYAGNVGIGMDGATPTALLHVNGSLTAGAASFTTGAFSSTVAVSHGTQAQLYLNKTGAGALSTFLFTQTDLFGVYDATVGRYVFTYTSSTNYFDAQTNFSIATNKFTVASATGNTVVAGTFQSTGNVSIGGTSTANMQLKLTGTGVSSSGYAYGLISAVAFDSSTTFQGTVASLQMKTVSAAFTTPTGHSLLIEAPSLANTAVTTLYGIRIENQGQAKSTNAYGIYIAAQSGAATLNWGLYNAGTSYFGGAATFASTVDVTGNVGIGNGATSTNSDLTLNGGASINNGAMIAFQRNSVTTAWIGHDSRINGGTSSNLDIYTDAATDIRFLSRTTLALTLSTGGAAVFTSSLTAGAASFTTIGATATLPGSFLANIANDSATGYGLKVRGGGVASYAFYLADHADALLLSVLGVSGACTFNFNGSTVQAGAASFTTGAFSGAMYVGGVSTITGDILRVKATAASGIMLEAAATDSRIVLYHDAGAFNLGATYGTTGSFLPIKFYTSNLLRATIGADGIIDLAQDLRIATNKFTVAAATGNTVVAGTLNIQGTTITVASGVSVIAAASDSAWRINGSTVDGFGGFITLYGHTHATKASALEYNAAGGHSFTGAATFASTVTATGAIAQVAPVNTAAFMSVEAVSNTYGATYRMTSKTSGGVSNTWQMGPNITGNANAIEWYDGTATRFSMAIGGAATFASTVTVTGGFGCNAATPQTAYASGGALAGYVTGAFGFDSDAHASELHGMVVKIRAALVANGIMS
jgi:hypothetical protein